MSDLSDNIIYNIERIRKEKHLSQDELAYLAGYEGNSTISKKLSGRSKITAEDLEAFAKALQVPVSRLLREIKHKERTKIMDVKGFYTYENLGLDPHTCVLPSDDMEFLTDPSNPETASDIRDIIASFYASEYEDYGPHQLYFWRSLDGTLGAAFSQIFLEDDGSPEKISMIINRDPKAEEEIVQLTINHISNAADPLEVTGIFIETEPYHWELVHE